MNRRNFIRAALGAAVAPSVAPASQNTLVIKMPQAMGKTTSMFLGNFYHGIGIRKTALAEQMAARFVQEGGTLMFISTEATSKRYEKLLS